jgi:nucleoside-diphosphate-sugar epimerase
VIKKVFITGGTGFLGVHLARFLLKKKYKVTLFDLSELDAKDLIGKVDVVKGDVRDKKALDNAIPGHDYVVHAAAALPIQLDRKVIYDTNIEGTRNVLASSLKNKVTRLVFISSTAVYGVPKHLPETETAPLDPIGHYGISKIEGEKLCLGYQKRGLQVNIIRPKTFLGIERLGVFELWYEAIFNNRSVFILGPGNNKYQLLAVTDIVDAIEKALVSKANGEIFNIGAEKFGTWRSDLGFVIKSVKSKSKIVSMPTVPSQLILQAFEALKLSPIAAWHYKTMPVDSYVSIEKAKKLLGWKPKKSNQDLFLESYLWYKENRSKVIGQKGNTHRVGWNFKILNLISKL